MSDACVPRMPTALSAPSLNRGVGFTHDQRRQLGLTGRLPSAVLTLEQQADRVWRQLQGMATDLGRYFKVLAEHLPELMPVVYTPTVGEAIQRFSDEYRGQRGLFLSIDETDEPDEIAEAFETFRLGPYDVDLTVCTDAEAILGIGDWVWVLTRQDYACCCATHGDARYQRRTFTAIAQQADPTIIGVALLPDVRGVCAISTTVAEPVYHVAGTKRVSGRIRDIVRHVWNIAES